VNLRERLTLYERLTRLDKPIGILLLLWPTLWGLWIAALGSPSPLIVIIFVLGTILMRSAGCILNDIADVNFDGRVARTRERPLAAGAIGVREALALAAVLVLLAFLLLLPLNRLTMLYSIPALFLAASYPYTKRFFALPQAYLGIAFGFGIPMAFAAELGRVPLLAWVLLLANIFWAMAYDTEYAMVDRDDDLKIGIKTAAITFGRYDVAFVMSCYVLMLGTLAWVGVRLHYGVFYFFGLLAAAQLAIYHYTLIKDRGREGCFKAFLHNNWLGAAIFAGIVADDLLHINIF
jgi:4-hydroxybenzoate polyprenyltransferase